MKKIFPFLETIAWLLVPGLSLFLLDQVLSLALNRRFLPPEFAFLYALVLLVPSLAGWALLAVLTHWRGPDPSCRDLAAVSASIAAVAAALTVADAFGDAARPVLKIALTLGWLTVSALIFIRARRKAATSQGWLAAAAMLLAVMEGWCIFPPAKDMMETDLYFLLHFGVLVLMCASLLAIRGRIAALRPIRALAPILLVLNLAFIPAQALSTRKTELPRARVRIKDPRPNIILIVWDTVRRDHLSLYGYDRPTSPGLDAFAQQALVYTNAEAVSPWTLPSHASMFTGMYPETHGAHNLSLLDPDNPNMGHRNLDLEATTLAEILSQNGYRCGAVSANLAFAGKHVNMDQGFEYFNDETNQYGFVVSHFDLLIYLTHKLKLHSPDRFLFPFMIAFPTADQVTRRAIAWVDTVSRQEQPFFLFLNYMDAHGPSYAQEELMYLFPGFQHDLLFLRSGENPAEKTTDPAELQRRRDHLVSQYDAEIIFMDLHFQQLLDDLARRGLLDQSIIILTSDHGEMFGERNGTFGHRFDLYRELLDIPLVIRYPRGERAGAESGTIENRELFFMAQRMAGIEARAEPYPWSAAAQEFENDPAISGPRTGGDAPFQRTFFFKQRQFIFRSQGPDELFGDETGPMKNIIAEDHRAAREGLELNEVYEVLIKKYDRIQSGPEHLSPADLERLKALGYIK